MSTRNDLRSEIEQAINRCSAEIRSETPDFILAEFLVACLDAWDEAQRARRLWYAKPEDKDKEAAEQ